MPQIPLFAARARPLLASSYEVGDFQPHVRLTVAYCYLSLKEGLEVQQCKCVCVSAAHCRTHRSGLGLCACILA